VRGFYFVLWKRISQTALTVFCSSEILTFYCPLFCSTDVAVGCVDLIFQLSITYLRNWDLQLAENLGAVNHSLSCCNSILNVTHSNGI